MLSNSTSRKAGGNKNKDVQRVSLEQELKLKRDHPSVRSYRILLQGYLQSMVMMMMNKHC